MVCWKLYRVRREVNIELTKLFSMDTGKHGEQSDSQRKVMVPRVRIWTRLSPMYTFRAFRDTYVRGCVTFGNSSKVNAIAHGAAFQISCNENSFSRSSSQSVRDNVTSAQELLELSAKFSREVSEQEWVQSGRTHLSAVTTGKNGLTLADLQGYASASPSPGRSPLRMSNRVSKLKLTDIQGHSGPLHKTGASGLPLNDLQGHSSPLRARPSFDTVPESEQYTDPRLSDSQLKMQNLFQTSALHPTEFLQSSSRRVASPASYYQLGLPTRTSGFAITRAASERLRPLSRYASTNSVPNEPSSPLPRASSRRPERFASMPSSARMKSSRRAVAPFDDFIRPRSGKSANKPNPYREYDTRLPSTPISV